MYVPTIYLRVRPEHIPTRPYGIPSILRASQILPKITRAPKITIFQRQHHPTITLPSVAHVRHEYTFQELREALQMEMGHSWMVPGCSTCWTSQCARSKSSQSPYRMLMLSLVIRSQQVKVLRARSAATCARMCQTCALCSLVSVSQKQGPLKPY